MTKTVACLFVVASIFSVGAQAADGPVEDARLKKAGRMIRVGEAGYATLGILALVGEARGHDETWLRAGLVAGVGAVVTGILGRRLKRKAERAGRENVVSIALPPPSSGKGAVGIWTVRW